MSLNVTEVLYVRRFRCGYEVRTEMWELEGCHSTLMRAAYTPNGDYIGDPKTARRLVHKRGIQPEKTDPNHSVCSVGYSVTDGKWYGWSHRAIYGFKVGSVCKKGHCHYVPGSFAEIRADCHCRKGKMCEANATVPVKPCDPEKPEGEQEACGPAEGIVSCAKKNCIFPLGRGEWVAETTADAKQMAIDFAEGVS